MNSHQAQTLVWAIWVFSMHKKESRISQSKNCDKKVTHVVEYVM